MTLYAVRLHISLIDLESLLCFTAIERSSLILEKFQDCSSLWARGRLFICARLKSLDGKYLQNNLSHVYFTVLWSLLLFSLLLGRDTVIVFVLWEEEEGAGLLCFLLYEQTTNCAYLPQPEFLFQAQPSGWPGPNVLLFIRHAMKKEMKKKRVSFQRIKRVEIS